jgi:RimJ/RimL family protein N-acetyltransferase
VNETIELKPLSKEDVSPAYVGWLNDPDVFKYLGIRHRRRPFTESDIGAFLKNCAKTHRFHWGIFVNGKHVGNISCSEWSVENRWIDISFIVGDRSVWSQGVATLAVGAAISYLFSLNLYNKIQAHSIIDNVSSTRVMEKLGMRRDALLRENAYLPDENRFADEVIYSILKREWDPNVPGLDRVKVTPMPWSSPETP